MSKPAVFVSIIILALIVGLLILGWNSNKAVSVYKTAAFAKCLKEKEVTMYGASWCPHCQNEKKAFGEDFQFVPYIECPENTQKCIDAGIEGYPTWILKDGKKLVGEQGLEKLAEASGCALEKK